MEVHKRRQQAVRLRSWGGTSLLFQILGVLLQIIHATPQPQGQGQLQAANGSQHSSLQYHVNPRTGCSPHPIQVYGWAVSAEASASCKGVLDYISSWDYITPDARRREVASFLYEFWHPHKPLANDVRYIAHSAFWFHVNHSSQPRSVIACVAPKVASTNVHYLFQRYNVGKQLFLEQTQGMRRYFDAVKRSKALFELPNQQTLSDPKIPRVIFVRNPYARLLSFFLMDKDFKWICSFMYGKPCSAVLPNNTKPNFAAFVDSVYGRWYSTSGQRWKQPLGVMEKRYNYHMFPQNWFCGQPLGMQFNVVVKIEELPYNFGCFVERLGLHGEVNKGWRHLNRLLNNNTADCFFRPFLDMPCDWWHYKEGVDTSTNSTFGKAIRFAGHSTGANSLLRRVYTETAKRKVAEMYQDDFVKYQYSFELP